MVSISIRMVVAVTIICPRKKEENCLGWDKMDFTVVKKHHMTLSSRNNSKHCSCKKTSKLAFNSSERVESSNSNPMSRRYLRKSMTTWECGAVGVLTRGVKVGGLAVLVVLVVVVGVLGMLGVLGVLVFAGGDTVDGWSDGEEATVGVCAEDLVGEVVLAAV